MFFDVLETDIYSSRKCSCGYLYARKSKVLSTLPHKMKILAKEINVCIHKGHIIISASNDIVLKDRPEVSNDILQTPMRLAL
jgi:hypothetical protein